MKTRIFLMLVMAAALVFSCQKEKNDPAVTEQEVTFSAIQIDPGAGLKSTSEWECINAVPEYAKVVLEKPLGTYYGTYYPLVFKLGTKWYTQAIKLPPGTYSVTVFALYDDIGPAGPDAGDPIYMATPNAGGAFSQYTNPDLPFPIEVTAFAKAEIPVEVLCFDQAEYYGFGFDWFVITEIIIREFCFFGDICLNGNGGVYPAWVPADYLGSWYDNAGVVEEDEEAYFKVVVSVNGVPAPVSTFYNNDVYPGNLPLCVQYPDKIGIVENFTFDIWVWVKTLTGYGYQLYGTFTSIDAGPLMYAGNPVPANTVADFAVGTCSPMSFVQWAWLPPLP
jgi:hypothetical protein